MYAFNFTAFTNQYAETTQNLSISIPDVIPSNVAAIVTGTGNLVFRKYDNLLATGSGTILSGSGLILGNTTGTGTVGVTLRSAG